jgi:choline dehydrogenase-like flavoprotein
MIGDARQIQTGSVLRCDICIVGAGAAGIALALQFEHAPQNIIVLESGGARHDAANQALARGSVAGVMPHPPLHRFRRRAFGGATTIWGGRCVPFDASDFGHRAWMPGKPWPITYEALLPYYAAAASLCEIGEFTFTAQAAHRSGMRSTLPGFEAGYFTQDTIERFSCPTDFAARYGARLKAAGNVTVLLHANATEIRTTETGAAATSLRVATLSGRRFSVRAQKFVLAAGGLEIPRLLLASRDHNRHGIGNAHDQVGRCYMTHLAGNAGKITLPKDAPPPFNGYERSDDGVYCRRRFALTARAQSALRCGNAVARLHHPALSDPAHRSGALSAVQLAKPFISFEYGTRLKGTSARAMLGHVRNVVQDYSGAASFAAHWLYGHSFAARKYPSLVAAPRAGPYSLDVHAEQAPNTCSRVMLGHARDALGMQKLVVDWRCMDIDTHTLRAALFALASDVARGGCAKLVVDEAEIDAIISREGAYGGHHIGTARMAAMPRDGVVDEDCRVFGMKNLFIAGSAVFPTSSQANPTLTIVALALRLKEAVLS